MLVDGVTVEYRGGGGVRRAQVFGLDFENPTNNDWLAVNLTCPQEWYHILC